MVYGQGRKTLSDLCSPTLDPALLRRYGDNSHPDANARLIVQPRVFLCYYRPAMRTDSTDPTFIPPREFHELDTQGLRCPEPVMMLHAAVREHGTGAIVHVLATDPATERDIPRFCRFLGHKLLHTVQAGELYEYWIRFEGRN